MAGYSWAMSRLRIGLGLMLSSFLIAPALAQSEAQLRADAVAFFQESGPRAIFIATDKGTRGYDPTSVRMFRDNYLRDSENGGCKITIANNAAQLGAIVKDLDGRQTVNSGVGFITIDWRQVVEIDGDGQHDYETGILLRGGISTSFGPKPALRIMGSLSSIWFMHAEAMQRICRAEQSRTR